MTFRQRYDLFLSLSLSARGFGYVAAEGQENPIDFGHSETNGPEKNRKCFDLIVKIIKRFRPDVLVLEDTRHPSSWRSRRIQQLSTEIHEFALDYGIPVVTISREAIKAVFAALGATTKDEIAEVIAERIPILRRVHPPVRKAWMAEDARLSIFHAMSMILTAHTLPEPT